MKKKYLLAPGPTPVPEHVALDMAYPMVHSVLGCEHPSRHACDSHAQALPQAIGLP